MGMPETEQQNLEMCQAIIEDGLEDHIRFFDAMQWLKARDALGLIIEHFPPDDRDVIREMYDAIAVGEPETDPPGENP